jgi:hypothetical protein
VILQNLHNCIITRTPSSVGFRYTSFRALCFFVDILRAVSVFHFILCFLGLKQLSQFARSVETDCTNAPSKHMDQQVVQYYYYIFSRSESRHVLSVRTDSVGFHFQACSHLLSVGPLLFGKLGCGAVHRIAGRCSPFKGPLHSRAQRARDL